jgi:acetylglutamate kinase
MTRVIKVGGRPQSDPALASAVAMDWNRANGGLVLVHGGGDEVSMLQTALGGSTTFVNGRRVTTEKDIDLVRMACRGRAKLVDARGRGIDAVGFSGGPALIFFAVGRQGVSRLCG